MDRTDVDRSAYSEGVRETVSRAYDARRGASADGDVARVVARVLGRGGCRRIHGYVQLSIRFRIWICMICEVSVYLFQVFMCSIHTYGKFLMYVYICVCMYI